MKTSDSRKVLDISCTRTLAQTVGRWCFLAIALEVLLIAGIFVFLLLDKTLSPWSMALLVLASFSFFLSMLEGAFQLAMIIRILNLVVQISTEEMPFFSHQPDVEVSLARLGKSLEDLGWFTLCQWVYLALGFFFAFLSIVPRLWNSMSSLGLAGLFGVLIVAGLLSVNTFRWESYRPELLDDELDDDEE